MGLGKMETGSFLREVRFLNREPEPEIDLFAGCWNGPGWIQKHTSILDKSIHRVLLFTEPL